MKRFVPAIIAAMFILGLATAASATPQQERMKACNAEAREKGLKGEQRKAFMKECLSAKKAETPKPAKD
ncbi:MAG TPA: PsiF family protein [Rhodocyclaceae bacterium]